MYEPQDGDFLFANGFNALVQALQNRAVYAGCEVSEGSGALGASDTLSVDSGTLAFPNPDGEVDVASTSITVDPNPEPGRRYDLVVGTTGGDVTVEKGTPGADADAAAIAPPIPSDTVLLAFVEVPAGTSSGDAIGELFDGRALYQPWGESDTREVALAYDFIGV